MTMGSGREEDQPQSDVDLVKTMALSSAELWHEILDRLREVQESQVRLAGAIETLGEMVRDALAPDARPVLGAHSKGASLEQSGRHVLAPPPASAHADPAEADLVAPAPISWPGPATVSPGTSRSFLEPAADAAGPGAAPTPDVPAAPKPAAASAATPWGQAEARPPGRHPGTEPESMMDALLGFKTPAPPADNVSTSVETSAQRPWSGAAEVPEPVFATEVPEPLFYVPPFEEEVLPATSVAELTPDALDALLAAEFGIAAAPTNGNTPPVEAAPSAVEAVEAVEPDTRPRPATPGDTHALDPLPAIEPPAPHPAIEPASALSVVEPPAAWSDVGSPAADTGPEVPSVVASPESPSPVASAEPPATRADTTRRAMTDPNVVLDILLGMRATTDTASQGDLLSPPVFTADEAPPPPPPPPMPPPVFTDEAPPPPPPVFTDPPPQPPPPPVLSDSAPSSVFADPVPPPQPRPPVFTSEALPASFAPAPDQEVPPPPAPPPPPPPAAEMPPPSFLPDEPPAFSPGEPPAPHLAVPPPPPLDLAAPDGPTPVFVEAEPLSPFYSTEDEATEPLVQGPFTSVASMATEILSATPEIPTVAVPETRESELISKDLTLIARGRKKRFRLR